MEVYFCLEPTSGWERRIELTFLHSENSLILSQIVPDMHSICTPVPPNPRPRICPRDRRTRRLNKSHKGNVEVDEVWCGRRIGSIHSSIFLSIFPSQDWLCRIPGCPMKDIFPLKLPDHFYSIVFQGGNSDSWSTFVNVGIVCLAQLLQAAMEAAPQAQRWPCVRYGAACACSAGQHNWLQSFKNLYIYTCKEYVYYVCVLHYYH